MAYFTDFFRRRLSAIRFAMRFLRFYGVHRRSRRYIEAWQYTTLVRLLHYLEQGVPLYRELLSEKAIQVSDITDLGDMRKLPIMRKQVFFGRFVEEFTDRTRPLIGHWGSTSGTSGVPFSPLQRANVRYKWFGDFLHYRFLFWERPWRFSIADVKIASIKIRSHTGGNRLFIPVRTFLEEPHETLAKLADFSPDVLLSYASLLHELAECSTRLGIRLRPRYLVSIGEQLTDASRRFIEETLHTQVYNQYGLEELGTVGIECRRHDGFHVGIESFVVEILDDSNIPVPEGSRGHIVITDLYNYQMPFVRYDTGDHGYMTWEPCKCGVSAPRLWIEGRYSGELTFNGRRIHHLEFDAALDTFMNRIHRYQLAKRDEENIVVRIIPGPHFSINTDTEIKAKIATLVGGDVTVHVEQVSEIQRVPSGKSRIIIDEASV